MNNTKKIFNKTLAVYLREHGCKIIKVEVNKMKPEFDVWVFEDNDHLQKCIYNWMQSR